MMKLINRLFRLFGRQQSVRRLGTVRMLALGSTIAMKESNGKGWEVQ